MGTDDRPDEDRQDENHQDEDHQAEEPNPAQQAKADPPTRPDRPTPSDEATLVQRDEGAHDEFADAPLSMEEPSERDASARRQQEEPAGEPGEGPADE